MGYIILDWRQIVLYQNCSYLRIFNQRTSLKQYSTHIYIAISATPTPTSHHWSSAAPTMIPNESPIEFQQITHFRSTYSRYREWYGTFKTVPNLYCITSLIHYHTYTTETLPHLQTTLSETVVTRMTTSRKQHSTYNDTWRVANCNFFNKSLL